MTDPRLERDLREVLALDAPEGAPAGLRDRVRADLARRTTSRGRAAWLAAAAAGLIVALGAIVLVGPWSGPPPSGSQSPAASEKQPVGTSSIETPFATVVPSSPAIAEPIADPGQLVGVDAITPTFGIATNADGLVLVTGTNGAIWRDVTPDVLRDSGLTISAEGVDPLNLRLITWNDNAPKDAAIWTSADSGQTWARSAIPIRRSFSGVVFLNPVVAWVLDTSARGLFPEIAWTGDGGRTWSDLKAVVPPDGFTYASLTFVTRELGFMETSDGDQRRTSFRTTDGGSTWSQVDLPPAPHPLGVSVSSGINFSDPDHGYMTPTQMTVADNRVTLHRLVYVTSDGGATWTYQFELEMEGRWSLVRFDDNTWVANNGTERRLSPDGGQTWQINKVSGLPDPAEYLSVDFVDATNGWAGSAPACLSDFCPFLYARHFKTIDGGLTWSLLGSCPPGSKGEFCEEPAH